MKKILQFILLMILYVLTALIILIKMDFIHIEFLHPKKETDEYIKNGLSLKDTNLNNSNGQVNNFYYNQLDTTSKKIYDKILENKDNMKNGTYEIEFEEDEFAEILNQENGLKILSNKYQSAVDSIRYDHIDLFYIDFTKISLRTVTYTRGKNKTYEVYLSPSEEQANYLEEYIQDLDNMLFQLEEKSTEILENAVGSNYQKIQYVHNWLIDNLQYDQTYSNENIRNIYGALIENDVVCEGYAKAFKYLLDKLNLPCIIVAGEAINSEGTLESHMWNYVQINDIWYAVDVTWDDPIIINGNNLSEEARYKYFCQGDNINTNHFASEIITNEEQKYIYPELYHKEN